MYNHSHSSVKIDSQIVPGVCLNVDAAATVLFWPTHTKLVQDGNLLHIHYHNTPICNILQYFMTVKNKNFR